MSNEKNITSLLAVTEEYETTFAEIERMKEEIPFPENPESQEKSEKQKNTRIRKTTDEKVADIDNAKEKLLKKVAQLEAKRQRLLLTPQDKTKIEDHCTFTIGGSVKKLLKIGVEKCTLENIEKESYEYLNKNDKKNRLYLYFVEELDKIFKK